MSSKFKEYKGLDLSLVNKEVLKTWDELKVFQKSTETRAGAPTFVFYEGPPSANGVPGIHHVLARTIKDLFCRYKTQQGFLVNRKAGWDTHGLPVELGVEKMLGITKEDIGKKVSVDEYNQACRTEVMKYTDLWEDLTRKMGYWVDMENPYVTYDNRYIETLWYLLKQLNEKGYLYKGYTIQPFSPAAGTGLSTHELNQPGCYRDVKDTTCVGLFRVKGSSASTEYFMAWTTTPWTLPSNTALAVGPKIAYVKVSTFNPYTGTPITVTLAENLLAKYFHADHSELPMEYEAGSKALPYRVLEHCLGSDLVGMEYEPIIPWVHPGLGAFRVIAGDFVTTEDGTGIVHIAPTFGADDDRVAKVSGVPPLLLLDKDGVRQPMVDRTGKFYKIADLDPAFVAEHMNAAAYREFEGRYVKNAFDDQLTPQDATLDVDLSVMLKKQGLVFRVEKVEHSYPHCWRTDKPVLYYPLDSWFIKTTMARERMMELNRTINWKPENTGTGRFGKWLENLQDWNLSRSRYWGTPLPIWRTEDGEESICIGSMKELMQEIERSMKLGFMKENPYQHFVVGDYSETNYNKIDLHRPYVDHIVLASPSGKPMKRELDLIDVWFDSGAMPYAQVHYPFEHEADFEQAFPADFIAEGVDQTRGWFFTLHALSTMLFDSVAFKNIISNGLVLDKKGNKMSKRLGNGVDPFEMIDQQGSDAVRWYMISNAQPWDNLKFDPSGIDEVKRKFFGTLYNTYSFFALYANVDGFTMQEANIRESERPQIDRWILSLLSSLVKEVTTYYESYEPTRAARAIQDFVSENLSNWYVRLNRKRFWGGDYDQNKIAAYQTLYTCLETVAQLASPIAPFYMDRLFDDLNRISLRHSDISVHLASFPKVDESLIHPELEEQMLIAQRITSLVLALRRKVGIKVRQPLAKLVIPVLDNHFKAQFNEIKHLVLSEVNVKEVEFITDGAGVLVKNIKANFKTLGPKYGKIMKDIALHLEQLTQEEIAQLELQQHADYLIKGMPVHLTLEDVVITSEDIPGWQVASDNELTVALDISLTDALRQEGVARELVNRIQNLRKDHQFEVTDRILIRMDTHKDPKLEEAVNTNKEYIMSQTLADSITFEDQIQNGTEVEIDANQLITVSISKI